MTTGYIAWDDGLLGALLHGLMANIPRWSFTKRWVHGHQCSGCQHRVVCTCEIKGKLNLVRCLWCTPWVMEWREPEIKRARRKITKKKAVRRKVTRRLSRAVP